MIKPILTTIAITLALIVLVICIGGCTPEITEEDKFILGDEVQPPYGCRMLRATHEGKGC